MSHFLSGVSTVAVRYIVDMIPSLLNIIIKLEEEDNDDHEDEACFTT
jgi:hypothetical protein